MNGVNDPIETYWTKLNFQTLPYHWNDRGKLQKDYLLSKIIYNQLILKLSQNFNSFHNTNYSNRYWKIILGPWLSSFIQLVLERYENLKQLKDKNYNLETVILDINKDLLLPSTLSHTKVINDDTWNHFIFSEILKTSDLFKNIHKGEFKDSENFNSYFRYKYNSKSRNIYSQLSSLFKKILKEKYLISEAIWVIDELIEF